MGGCGFGGWSKAGGGGLYPGRWRVMAGGKHAQALGIKQGKQRHNTSCCTSTSRLHPRHALHTCMHRGAWGAAELLPPPAAVRCAAAAGWLKSSVPARVAPGCRLPSSGGCSVTRTRGCSPILQGTQSGLKRMHRFCSVTSAQGWVHGQHGWQTNTAQQLHISLPAPFTMVRQQWAVMPGP